MVALGGLASGIAHELNQPLAAISTYNEACLRLLRDNSYSAGELHDAMQKCRDQARRAGAIIQRLRELLRQPVRPMAHLELAEVATSVRKLATPEAAEAGVSLELDLAAGLPRVSSDQLLIEQVVLNFVRNAIEAVRSCPASASE
jgi:two-component system sensor histidine kinase DctS